jgi:hypothetical protein
MRNRVVIGFCALVLFNSVSVNASSQIPADRRITKIQSYDTYVAITFSPSFTNNEGCAGAGQANSLVIDLTSSAHAKSMYATALAAYMQGKNVGFGINGCYAWGGGVPKAYRIDI